VRYDIEENVAEITLDQPEKHNPLNDQATRDLVDVLETVLEDDEARAVLLTGAGESFSAGGDIGEFSERLDQRATHIFDDGEASARLFSLLAEYEKPIVAAVNGHAFGGGCGLVAACHMAYAASDAKLGTTEIHLGIFPLTILPALRTTLGDQKTLEMSLTGERMSAARAAEIGLVTEAVADADAAVERARETAREIADKSPFAVRMGLHVFHQTSDMTPEKAIDALNAYRVLFFKSHDLNEGAQAFLEDREPEWKGY
jgi:methylglutaconyl-CoA hydratase